MKKARAKGVSFLIPVDNIVAREYKEDADFMRIYSDAIPDGWMGLDIGPTTQELFTKTIAGSGTVIWNGPMGVSEWENFAAGTRRSRKGCRRVRRNLDHRRRRQRGSRREARLCG